MEHYRNEKNQTRQPFIEIHSRFHKYGGNEYNTSALPIWATEEIKITEPGIPKTVGTGILIADWFNGFIYKKNTITATIQNNEKIDEPFFLLNTLTEIPEILEKPKEISVVIFPVVNPSKKYPFTIEKGTQIGFLSFNDLIPQCIIFQPDDKQP